VAQATKQTLDSLGRLAGHDRAGSTQVNVAVQNNLTINQAQTAERLIQQFDAEPDLKRESRRRLIAKAISGARSGCSGVRI
jgi:hypothetical protein